MATRDEEIALATLNALPDLTGVARVDLGVFRAVRRTKRGDEQRLRMRLSRTEAGFEFRVLDEHDPGRWAFGERRASSATSEHDVQLTILGTRWFDLDRPRAPPTGPEWEF